jgi:glycosyltransferase involved in cell wall biosynthesis
MPLISVGMPVYNGENYIEPAIESILNQTFDDFRLIISDNASTDRTEEICHKYTLKDTRIRYFRNQKNLGAAHNFNLVFKLSSSKYFMWAAHDDIYAPNFLSSCIKVLEQNAHVVLCFAKTKFIDEHGILLKDYDYAPVVSSPSPTKRFFQIVLDDYIVVEIFGLIRSDILRKTPLIGYYAGADKVLLGELALHGPFFEIPEYLFFHREHSQRSAKVHTTLQSYITWWAPAMTSHIRFPTWRLFFETLKAIGRGPQNSPAKIIGYLQMIKWVICKRMKLINDIIMVIRQIRLFGSENK